MLRGLGCGRWAYGFNVKTICEDTLLRLLIGSKNEEVQTAVCGLFKLSAG